MKEFDINKAEAGHPVCTRGGHRARILAFDLKNERPLVVAIENDDGKEWVAFYGLDGIFHGENNLSEDDLMLTTIKHEGWVNIFKTGHSFTTVSGSIYPSEDEAKSHGQEYADYITTIKIEWED